MLFCEMLGGGTLQCPAEWLTLVCAGCSFTMAFHDPIDAVSHFSRYMHGTYCLINTFGVACCQLSSDIVQPRQPS